MSPDRRANGPGAQERPVDGRSTRWQAHRARRREQVVDAALLVLGREGRDLGLDQVAHEAGVTKPVIYRHFGDRAALLDAMAERATNLLMERLMPVLYDEGAIRPRIRASVGAFIGFLDESPNVDLLFRRRLPGQGGDVVDAGREFVAAALTDLLSGYLGSLGFDVPELVQVWGQSLVGAVQATAEWWLAHRTMQRDVVTEHLTALIWAQIDGIARQHGMVLDPDAPLPKVSGPK
ncbi:MULTISPECIES: TetR/AcrR family transcriptional regulator [Pseudonocardia]|uniref:DNA-binding transcriptional repressor FabR n=2 Tax=Pseudonocardia TaxID=1847 RepID=A0A1Y2MXV9_PSEAH|nr:MULTISPECIES: TetR/AcrR family transcriptional regulator [Pseudonocardia]OSY39478.1 DNA-binding transcriptional repressor FabR [Pseudonocardia autotrophica]TDN75284.1 TetR family transcriptional regulator [Pseudonocardia autotrophica]BBF99230.1 TetR family transcriptional regulator [Pseudonocardia autotrophica]GEC24776.1 TetR family transcriptional regulator [Pseudonocardia saturnea]